MAAVVLLLAATIVAGRALSERFGSTGAIADAAIAGRFDVDAITASMAHLAPHPLSPRSAALAIVVAASTDAISKIVTGSMLGGGRFAAAVGAMASGCLLLTAPRSGLWLTLLLLPSQFQ